MHTCGSHHLLRHCSSTVFALHTGRLFLWETHTHTLDSRELFIAEVVFWNYHVIDMWDRNVSQFAAYLYRPVACYHVSTQRSAAQASWHFTPEGPCCVLSAPDGWAIFVIVLLRNQTRCLWDSVTNFSADLFWNNLT